MMMGLLQLHYRSDKTPDFIELKNSKWARHLVLVYDDLKRGRPNNFLMNGANYYGRAHTMAPNLCLKKTGHGVAVAIKPQKITTKRNGTGYFKFKETGQILRDAEVGRVEGELYSVSLRHLTTLDKANNNTVLFQREKMWVVMQDEPNKGKTVQVWVYIAIPEEFNKKWPYKDLRFANMLRKENVNVHYT